MTNVVITCAKPKASTLKEDGNIQKLVVIPASITQLETTDPLETKQVSYLYLAESLLYFAET